jgi:hypothetical protein
MRQNNQIELNLGTGAKGEAPSIAAREKQLKSTRPLDIARLRSSRIEALQAIPQARIGRPGRTAHWAAGFHLAWVAVFYERHLWPEPVRFQIVRH